jgi:hypothetical protein
MRLIPIGNDMVELPEELVDVVDAMPARIDRNAGAKLVTEHIFPTSPKTVKSWPLPWECPNGKAIAPPATYLAYALLKARKAATGNARWFRTTPEPADAAA